MLPRTLGPPNRSPRALVVDDDAPTRRALSASLRAGGFEVVEAADGVSGLRAVVDHLLSLDLLVTDVEMPGLSGEALVRTIRTLGGEKDLPILVVTGALPASRGPSLRAAGVDGFTLKSAGLDAVTRMARDLLAARGWPLDERTPLARIALRQRPPPS